MVEVARIELASQSALADYSKPYHPRKNIGAGLTINGHSIPKDPPNTSGFVVTPKIGAEGIRTPIKLLAKQLHPRLATAPKNTQQSVRIQNKACWVYCETG